MNSTQRESYRQIQDEFLARPEILHVINTRGWNTHIAWSDISPTYAQLRDQLHPSWIPWMIDYMRDE